jgi:alpha-glucosidase
MYGADLLVAPVHKSSVSQWRAYLPEGETWVHLWSGKAYEGGQTVQVDAPFEQIPVFYRMATQWASLFQKLLTV